MAVAVDAAVVVLAAVVALLAVAVLVLAVVAEVVDVFCVTGVEVLVAPGCLASSRTHFVRSREGLPR